jgi:hypothetical protein
MTVLGDGEEKSEAEQPVKKKRRRLELSRWMARVFIRAILPEI